MPGTQQSNCSCHCRYCLSANCARKYERRVNVVWLRALQRAHVSRAGMIGVVDRSNLLYVKSELEMETSFAKLRTSPTGHRQRDVLANSAALLRIGTARTSQTGSMGLFG